ncbi:MAG: extensin family protein [Pseudomonadota bacterium]
MFPYYLRHRKAAPTQVQRSGFGQMLARMVGYAILLCAVIFAGIVIGPGLPDRYNPFAALDPTAPPDAFTRYKLDRATRTPEACFAALEMIDTITFSRRPDREESAQCHIRGHVALSGLSRARLQPVSTTCGTALRLYMWEQHRLQPAAEAHLGARIAQISHQSSYSCRRIRTVNGPGEQMSAHATADAIDINGVILEDGRELGLRFGWGAGDAQVRSFWRAARDGACDTFRTVLSPAFNTLHADHFHLAQGRYGACR